MGVVYVNPPTERKEAFLRNEGTEIDKAPQWSEVPEGTLPVVLVDNGPFTAAGIAFSERELREFSDPGDYRPKRWYIVPIRKLLEVSNLTDYRPDLLV